MDTKVSVILQYILVIYYNVDITVQSYPAKHLNNLLQGGHNGFSHPEIYLNNLLQRGQLVIVSFTPYCAPTWTVASFGHCVIHTLHYASIIYHNEDSVSHCVSHTLHYASIIYHNEDCVSHPALRLSNLS